MKRVLVTGGAGFVGTHLVEHILKNTDWEVVTLDRFDAAGNPNRLNDMLSHTEGIDRSRIKFVFWDLRAELNDQVIKQLGTFDYIMHLAAGSHVDRSIEDPLLFFQDNCIGTVNILNYVRKGGLQNEDGNYGDSKFLYFSTDEVFGPAPLDMEGGYKEWDRQNPNNPYAAAKSAAEMAVISFANTYSIPCVITNTMNIYGERQSPEKFIPLVINSTLQGDKLFIHANKEMTQAGMRHYLHARNISAAATWIIENGKTLDGSATEGRYNIVGEVEMDNLTLALKVADMVNDWQAERGNDRRELDYELVDFHSSRPGHDLRYALDGKHLAEAGFSYPVDFDASLRKMIYWSLEHKGEWL